VSSFELVELSPDLADEASKLLAEHIGNTSPDSIAECREALFRLLEFPGAHMLLARQGNECCGFMALHWGFSTTKGLPILRVQDLFVAPGYRRKGIATALLDQAAIMAKQAGANRLQLETGTENTEARALYTSYGFEWSPGKEIYMHFLRG
jgi:ribosomal protein S18 acetylase RimI-like enzyme